MGAIAPKFAPRWCSPLLHKIRLSASVTTYRNSFQLSKYTDKNITNFNSMLTKGFNGLLASTNARISKESGTSFSNDDSMANKHFGRI